MSDDIVTIRRADLERLAQIIEATRNARRRADAEAAHFRHRLAELDEFITSIRVR